MKIGDLVRDIDTGDLAVILEIDPVWKDPKLDPKLSSIHKWDYLLHHPKYGRYYVDRAEIEMIG